jgi:hypothetical protein
LPRCARGHVGSRGGTAGADDRPRSDHPHGALSDSLVVVDPWPVPLGAAAATWSAAGHWGLTEQLFTATVVFTTRDARPRESELSGVRYVARRIPEGRLFETRRVWRDRVPVSVSDPPRTLVDVLDDPRLGGGATPREVRPRACRVRLARRGDLTSASDGRGRDPADAAAGTSG